jgi:hypothetical protein
MGVYFVGNYRESLNTWAHLGSCHLRYRLDVLALADKYFGGIMKSLFLTFLAAFFSLLLCGCPDSKLPNPKPCKVRCMMSHLV